MVLYQPFILLTILMVVVPSESKNYYLMENEVENSQYVYSLFGLTNIVSKFYFFPFLGAKIQIHPLVVFSTT